MNYELAFPQRVIFGWETISQIGSLAKTLGSYAVLFNGSRTLEQNGTLETIRRCLSENGVAYSDTFAISHEPLAEDVDRIAESVRKLDCFKNENRCDNHCENRTGKAEKVFVLAIGGGAALDLAKAVAALVTQNENTSILDYLEGVGKELTLQSDPLPVFAVPTTAGTGSEATKNAVIQTCRVRYKETSYKETNCVETSCDETACKKKSDVLPAKKSIRDIRLLPKIALIDPQLTVSAPAKVTAESGMDAITQLLESYVSKKSQPFTSALCEQGLILAFNSIIEAVEKPESRTARENMSHAAFLSGVCLANAGLGFAHGVAPVLGSYFNITHGAACALLLPFTIRANAQVAKKRYAKIARLVLEPLKNETHKDSDVFSDEYSDKYLDDYLVEMLIKRITDICVKIGIPMRFEDYGITSGDFPLIAKNAKGGSMQTNPQTLTEKEICDLLQTGK